MLEETCSLHGAYSLVEETDRNKIRKLQSGTDSPLGLYLGEFPSTGKSEKAILEEVTGGLNNGCEPTPVGA